MIGWLALSSALLPSRASDISTPTTLCVSVRTPWCRLSSSPQTDHSLPRMTRQQPPAIAWQSHASRPYGMQEMARYRISSVDKRPGTLSGTCTIRLRPSWRQTTLPVGLTVSSSFLAYCGGAGSGDRRQALRGSSGDGESIHRRSYSQGRETSSGVGVILGFVGFQIEAVRNQHVKLKCFSDIPESGRSSSTTCRSQDQLRRHRDIVTSAHHVTRHGCGARISSWD